MGLKWEPAGTDEPGDQNAESNLADHAHWSVGPTFAGRWSVELIVRNESGDEVPYEGVSLGTWMNEEEAKGAAQRREDAEGYGI